MSPRRIVIVGVGDVAYAHNRQAGRRLRIEHWGDPLGQGELAGRVRAGVDAQAAGGSAP